MMKVTALGSWSTEVNIHEEGKWWEGYLGSWTLVKKTFWWCVLCWKDMHEIIVNSIVNHITSIIMEGRQNICCQDGSLEATGAGAWEYWCRENDAGGGFGAGT